MKAGDMKISQGSAAERFANYITRENLASLPADVITKTKLCFQDSIGCFLGAWATPVARIMAGFSAGISASGAQQIAPWSKPDCGTAALLHSALIHALA